MKHEDITNVLETLAPLSLQEDYDNSGMILGDGSKECKGVMISLDVTESVVDEAIEKRCNLIISHHPIIFNGIKKLTDNHYVQKHLLPFS